MSNVFESSFDNVIAEMVKTVSDAETAKRIADINKYTAERIKRGNKMDKETTMESVMQMSPLEDASTDVRNLRKYFNNALVAKVSIALGLDMFAYLNADKLDRVTWSRRTGLDTRSYSKNIKGMDKLATMCEYFASANYNTQSVLKHFITCFIVTSQVAQVLPTVELQDFLRGESKGHNEYGKEIQDYLDAHRASQMTGGAETQTSQCTLVLSFMRAVNVLKAGRGNAYSLRLDSPVLIAFAQRFDLMSQLNRAQRLAGVPETKIEKVKESNAEKSTAVSDAENASPEVSPKKSTKKKTTKKRTTKKSEPVEATLL